jgi:ABC-2 type transport system permease protein
MDARMTYTIARREWRERLRNGHFQAVIVALALLFLVSFAVSLSQWKSADAEQRQAQSRDREQWLNQGSRNPHSAAHFGVYAFKPRLPLSFVDPGLDPYTGSVIWVEAHYQNPARFRPAEEATALQRFGQLTPAVVLQWFLPLFIVLLCFSAFTAEKEQGTLGLTLALGVPPGQLAAGKALGVAAAAGCILLPVALLTGLAVWVTGPESMRAETWLRLIPMAVSYLAYLAIFAFVSLTVSVVSSSSRASLATLLGFWTVATFVVPRVAADTAETIHPSPLAADFWREIAIGMRGVDGHSENDKRILELKRRTMQKYGVSRAEDLPVNFEGLRLQAGEEHGNELFDQYYGKLWSAYERQERLHLAASLTSPLLALRSISMSMAGTDLAHFRDFTEATERYRRSLNKAMNLNVANHSRTGEYYYFADRSLWESIPAHQYSSPTLAWALHRQVLPAVILSVWLFASIAAFRFATNRMKPL